jgi:hypothetical protein
MIPTLKEMMINSKRKIAPALAVYDVDARPLGGCFFRSSIPNIKTQPTFHEKNSYEKTYCTQCFFSRPDGFLGMRHPI